MNSIKKTAALFKIKKGTTKIENVKVTCQQDAVDFARKFYFEDIEVFESVFIILLDRNATTIGFAKISQGGVAGTVVDPKIIAFYAVNSLASSVILVHNHPSGNTAASEADKAITLKVQRGLELLDIKLLDHIILTKEGHGYINID
jgi:DNA repair protein RadC